MSSQSSNNPESQSRIQPAAFSQCLVEPDPATAERIRHRRQRALGISAFLEVSFVVALLIWPLFATGSKLVRRAYIPIPPYGVHHAPTRPEHANIQSPIKPSMFHVPRYYRIPGPRRNRRPSPPGNSGTPAAEFQTFPISTPTSAPIESRRSDRCFLERDRPTLASRIRPRPHSVRSHPPQRRRPIRPPHPSRRSALSAASSPKPPRWRGTAARNHRPRRQHPVAGSSKWRSTFHSRRSRCRPPVALPSYAARRRTYRSGNLHHRKFSFVSLSIRATKNEKPGSCRNFRRLPALKLFLDSARTGTQFRPCTGNCSAGIAIRKDR